MHFYHVDKELIGKTEGHEKFKRVSSQVCVPTGYLCQLVV